MGYFRFHRIIKMLPGVRMNLSKSGPSFSFGVKGARVNVGPKRVRTTVGVPGSGLSYIHEEGRGESKTIPPSSSKPPASVRAYEQNRTFPDAEAVLNYSNQMAAPSQSPATEIVADAELGPRNQHLYALTEKWYPKIARSRTNERLQQWLVEIEQEYNDNGYDRHAYELRRRIILAEMLARARGVRPKPMTKWEQDAFTREAMVATVADETSRPIGKT